MATIREDFEYELTRINDGRSNDSYNIGYEYKNIVLGNIAIKEALYKEFSELASKPKLHWYYSSFISDGTCSKVILQRAGDARLDKVFYWLRDRFFKKCQNNAVEDRHYGRLINETNTIKLLNEIYGKVEAFKKYVFTNANSDTYEAYAKATCRNIIALSNQIAIPELKHAILSSFVNNKENDHIVIRYLYKVNAENEKIDINQRYDTLKNYADALLREELAVPFSKGNPTAPPPATTGIPVFNPEIIEPVYNILKPYFAPEQHTQLNELLTTGRLEDRLHFRSTGNRLADAFKQLIDEDLITNCTKKELESWIERYFTYTNNKTKSVNNFILKYLNDVISFNSKETIKCKRPLLKVDKEPETGKRRIIQA